MGGREVSRESFRHALKGGRSCLVVPGGQAEMLQSQSDDDDVSQIVYYVMQRICDFVGISICSLSINFS